MLIGRIMKVSNVDSSCHGRADCRRSLGALSVSLRPLGHFFSRYNLRHHCAPHSGALALGRAAGLGRKASLSLWLWRLLISALGIGPVPFTDETNLPTLTSAVYASSQERPLYINQFRCV